MCRAISAESGLLSLAVISRAFWMTEICLFIQAINVIVSFLPMRVPRIGNHSGFRCLKEPDMVPVRFHGNSHSRRAGDM